MQKTQAIVAASELVTRTGRKQGCLGRYLQSVQSRINYNNAMRAAERQLQSLDDRLLRDIGIVRSEIPFAVRNRIANRLRAP